MRAAPGHVTAAASEHAVWTRSAAAGHYGDGILRAHLDGGRWQEPVSGVVVGHNGPLTDEQLMWAALLAGPRGTMLHGLSAAVVYGFTGFEPDALTIVTPGPSRNCRSVAELHSRWGVQLRWSTKLGPADVNPEAVPPRTRLARSIVDAASQRVPERRARVLVLASVQQRLVRTPALWDALSRRGHCRNRALIAESIVDAAGGIESLPEREFDQIRLVRGLPEPTRQAVLQRRDGRYYLDVEFQPWAVRAEVHGIPHLGVRSWDRDLERQNEISIDGNGLLVFSSYAIRRQPRQVGDQLVRMLQNRGWRG